jgi:hypothetical protein
LSEFTPSDFFVFSSNSTIAEEGLRLCDPPTRLLAHVHFLPLDDWVTPATAEGPEFWLARGFDEDYRRMGHWRLTSQFQFAYHLGYKYILQVDDDSWFTSRIMQNIVQLMETQNYTLAGRILNTDPVLVTTGLPELVKYFLVVEGHKPTQLLEHCSPKNVSGLYTSGMRGLFGTSNDIGGGWSRKVIYGNFVVVSTEFWYRPDVQRFVKLVVQTGGHFTFRWNEQGVMAMVWQMFTEPGQFHLFDFGYKHPSQCKYRTGQH